MGTWMETQISTGRVFGNIDYIYISRSDIDREWRLGCGDDAYITIRMEKLEEGIVASE